MKRIFKVIKDSFKANKSSYGSAAAGLLVVVAIGLATWTFNETGKKEVSQFFPATAAMVKDASPWFKVEKDVSSLMADIQKSNISAVGMGFNAVLATTKKGEKYVVIDTRFGRVAEAVISALKRDDIKPFPLVSVPHVVSPTGPTDMSSAQNTAGVIFNGVVMLILVGAVLYSMTDGKFGLFRPEKDTGIKFDDVIGVKEAKFALKDVATYLREPESFARFGVRQMAGVIMAGSPGTGKTLLAKALAGECGVSFLSATGADFNSKYVGVGALKVKSLFAAARKNAPCIVFIDELDGVGRRSQDDSAVSTENNRIINTILTEMNGFKPADGVVVIAATNLMSNVEPALLRDGRFDRRVQVKLPDMADRAELFKLYTASLPLASDIDFLQLARMTTGMSPASISTLANQAAVIAAKSGDQVVLMANFIEAIEIAAIGEANGGAVLSEDDRKRIAVHESGHALIAKLLNTGKVEKISILPRGDALGITWIAPQEDKHLHLKSEIEAKIEVALGGRCAELLFFGEASSGAAQDLQHASNYAFKMVSEFGLGDDGSLFSLAAFSGQHVKPDIRHEINKAEQILRRLEKACMERLTAHRGALQYLTDELLTHETVPESTLDRALQADEAAAAA